MTKELPAIISDEGLQLGNLPICKEYDISAITQTSKCRTADNNAVTLHSECRLPPEVLAAFERDYAAKVMSAEEMRRPYTRNKTYTYRILIARETIRIINNATGWPKLIDDGGIMLHFEGGHTFNTRMSRDMNLEDVAHALAMLVNALYEKIAILDGKQIAANGGAAKTLTSTTRGDNT